MKIAAITDYREAARRRLPKFLFEYVDGGAYAEVTLRRNVEDLQSVALRQLVMRDVDKVDLSTTLFGRERSMPVGLGPIGLSGMYARRGEVQAAQAAEAAGVPFCLSTVSCCPIAEVVRGVSSPIWFQLYMIRDRGFMVDLLAQAQAAKCSALVFTVDMPVPGTRYRDYRSGLAGAPGAMGDLRRVFQAMQRPDWAWDVGVMGRPHGLGNVAPVLGANSGLEDFFAWIRNNFDARVTWKDLDFVREHWKGPLIIKGVLDAEDARAVVDVGADGLVVSNHGGRQLDGVSSTARALPRIAEAVDRRLTILADGGVRSGLDVVRMLALGANGVLLGRAWAYALAARGRAGVAHVLDLVAAEMRVAMSLTGCVRIVDIGTNALDEAARALSDKA
jgi:L-lactate dehydrogenase (cytochrome)